MSYSQSKQDLFAMKFNPGPGVFVDIGCSIPTWQSNVRLLMENGWRGVALDSQDHSAAWSGYPAKFICADSTIFPWDTAGLPETIQYLSCDCDSATFLALQNFMKYGFRVNCATIEHDAYRFGDTLRTPIRNYMKELGYVMVVENVDYDGCQYEDWFTHADFMKGKV